MRENRFRIGTALLVLAAASCAVERTPAPPPAPCAAVDPALSALMGATDLLVLGEVHGTNECPAFALEAVCAGLAQGGAVVLGLEIPRTEQGAFDRYLDSAGTSADRDALLGGAFWRTHAGFGHASVAMLELIEHARQLRAGGRPLTVLCFDMTPEDGAYERRDEYMAGHVLGRRAAGTKIVLLVGNAHSPTSREGAGFGFRPMGSYLAEQDSRLVSLSVRNAGGQAWCFVDRPGVHTFLGDGVAQAHGPELFPARDADGHDGRFDVGPISASLPVLPEAVETEPTGAASGEAP